MPRTNANAITTTKVLNITFRERELGQSRIFAKSYEEYARKPERFWENRYLNQIILERLATTTDSAYIYATATDVLNSPSTISATQGVSCRRCFT